MLESGHKIRYNNVISKILYKGVCFVRNISKKDNNEKRTPVSRGEIVRRAVMILCACVFVISAALVVRHFIDYKRGGDLYGDISDDVFNSDLASDRAVSMMIPSKKLTSLREYNGELADSSWDVLEADGERGKKLSQMRTNLYYLKAVNPDVYGYIYVDGTRISFPVVKGEDNEYYLKRAYNNEYMVCGAIYADYRNDDDFEANKNVVLYGHNMLDGNMFNNVMLFKDEDVFNSKLIEIYTTDGLYIYEPFAIFKTTYDFPYFRTDFTSDEDFVSFCEQMQELSIHNKNMTFTGQDKIITLSTCTPSSDVEYYFVGRYALHARLVRVEQ